MGQSSPKLCSEGASRRVEGVVLKGFTLFHVSIAS